MLYKPSTLKPIRVYVPRSVDWHPALWCIISLLTRINDGNQVAPLTREHPRRRYTPVDYPCVLIKESAVAKDTDGNRRVRAAESQRGRGQCARRNCDEVHRVGHSNTTRQSARDARADSRSFLEALSAGRSAFITTRYGNMGGICMHARPDRKVGSPAGALIHT
jgi:hypothetical protein